MVQPIIEQLFFENPAKHFHIREIARQFHLPKTTVAYTIASLVEQKVITRQKHDIFISFKANETNEQYKYSKLQNFIKQLIDSKLLDHIESHCAPKCIILFGSFAKAEYDVNSDVDLFVQAKECKLKIADYEKRLGHEINILFEPELKRLSPELLNNIVNGAKLRGFIKIK